MSATQLLDRFHSRYDNPNFYFSVESLFVLRHQLEHKTTVDILTILRRAQSTFVETIDELIVRLDREMKRAESNIRYLELLIDPCDQFAAADSLAALPLHLPKIIHLVIFIWTRSEFYCSQAAITKLFRLVGNQIVHVCRCKIDIESALSGNERSGIKVAKQSIDCCLYFKVIYEKLVVDDRPFELCRLDANELFHNVDAFIRRLSDFIEICSGISVFGERSLLIEDTTSCSTSDDGRSDTATAISPSTISSDLRMDFSGDRAVEFERNICEIETQFGDELQRLKCQSNRILDILDTAWTQTMQKYRTAVERLELIIENLIENVFACVQNVDEGIHSFACLYRFAACEKFRDAFTRQTRKIWKIFADEISRANKIIGDQSNDKHSPLPPIAGHAVHLRCNRDRLLRMRLLLEQTICLPRVHEATDILGDCEKWTTAATRSIQKSFDDWLASVGVDATSRLNRTLIKRSVTHPGLFECNVDATIFGVFDEAKTFKAFGFGFPVHISQFIARETSTRSAFYAIMQTIAAHNFCVAEITDKERLMFRPLIEKCDRVFLVGVHRLTWTSDGIETFIAECNLHVAEFRDFLSLYRDVNERVIDNCTRIASIVVADIEPKTMRTLTVIENDLDELICRRMLEIVTRHNDILRMLFEVYRVLEAHMEKVNEFLVSFEDISVRNFVLLISFSVRFPTNGVHTFQNWIK